MTDNKDVAKHLRAPQAPASAPTRNGCGDYVAVPREPTEAMLEAVEAWRMRADGPRYVWSQMIAAAKSAPDGTNSLPSGESDPSVTSDYTGADTQRSAAMTAGGCPSCGCSFPCRCVSYATPPSSGNADAVLDDHQVHL